MQRLDRCTHPLPAADYAAVSGLLGDPHLVAAGHDWDEFAELHEGKSFVFRFGSFSTDPPDRLAGQVTKDDLQGPRRSVTNTYTNPGMESAIMSVCFTGQTGMRRSKLVFIQRDDPSSFVSKELQHLRIGITCRALGIKAHARLKGQQKSRSRK